LTISTSFGVSMNLQGLFRKYAKKPLQKTSEGSGTQRELAPKKEASRRIKDPPDQSGPRGGPPQPERPRGGAGRPLGPKPPHLLECSSTAS
jgi:hypothetical protein